MAFHFHHRKSLISEPNKNPNFSKKFATDSCYLCYVCPEDCYVTPPPPPPPPPELSGSSKNHIPTVLILMLCVLGVAFLVLSYLTIARYRNSRSRGDPPPPETSTASFADENQVPILDHPIWFIRTVGLPQSVIDSIASFKYRNGDGLIDGNDCSVCLNDFQHDETLRLLPKCSHAFHLDCIDTWLRSHKSCPVCRAPVVAEDGTGGDRGGGERVRAAEPSPSSSLGSGELESRAEIGRDDVNVIVQVDGVIAGGDDVAGMEKVSVVVSSGVADRTAGIESFDRDLQPVRRSVSMDLSCASIIYEVGDEGCSDHTRLKTVEKRNPSSSFRVKRSFSFSGKRKK